MTHYVLSTFEHYGEEQPSTFVRFHIRRQVELIKRPTVWNGWLD